MAVSTKEILRNFEAASVNEVTLAVALGCGGAGCSGWPCARCQDDEKGAAEEEEDETGAVTEGEVARLEEGSTAKFLSRSVVGRFSCGLSDSPQV